LENNPKLVKVTPIKVNKLYLTLKNNISTIIPKTTPK
jgi:hypothetical protein